MKRKNKLPWNIQFFADGGDQSNPGEGGQDSGGDGNNAGGDPEGNNAGKDTNTSNNQKTFTQEEVNRMMTREKKEGKKSILTSLGFKTEDEAKSAVKLLNALMDSQKTPEDKANDKANKSEADKDEAERRAERAENKLACVMAGVSKDSVDDVLAIALLKVSDDKSLEKVLEDMKKESRYNSFFGTNDTSNNNSGTGTTPGHGNGGGSGKDGDYGKMLFESSGMAPTKKSSFFEED